MISRIRSQVLGRYIALSQGSEEGQGLAEYGLILALIAVVCIAALTTLGGGINTTLGSINGAL
jgi:pilus assembly protein Flp/PilA